MEDLTKRELSAVARVVAVQLTRRAQGARLFQCMVSCSTAAPCHIGVTTKVGCIDFQFTMHALQSKVTTHQRATMESLHLTRALGLQEPRVQHLPVTLCEARYERRIQCSHMLPHMMVLLVMLEYSAGDDAEMSAQQGHERRATASGQALGGAGTDAVDDSGCLVASDDNDGIDGRPSASPQLHGLPSGGGQSVRTASARGASRLDARPHVRITYLPADVPLPLSGRAMQAPRTSVGGTVRSGSRMGEAGPGSLLALEPARAGGQFSLALSVECVLTVRCCCVR